MSKPAILNILVDNEVCNVNSTTTPLIKWQYYDLESEQKSYILKIGSTPGNDDILNTGEIITDFNEYVVTPVGYDSSLKNGIRYYITLIVCNVLGECSEEAGTFFVTNGDYWESHVDNGVGWTVEFYVKFNSDYMGDQSDLADVVSPEVNLPHHDVEFRDGSRLSFLQIFSDRVIVRGNSQATYFLDNRCFHLYRVVGQGDDLRVYIDDFLAVDLTNFNTVETTERQILFGTTTNDFEVSSTWCSILMFLEGMKLPNDLPAKGFDVTSFFFYEEDMIDTASDGILKDKIYVGVNPEDQSLPGKIYTLYKNSKSIKFETRPFLSFEALNIVQDTRGAKWAHTRNNLFKISGEIGGDFSQEYTFEEESNLTEFFRATNCVGQCADFGSLMRINTVNEAMDSFWYYETVKNGNSQWYDFVNNDKGWTVETEVRIASDGGSVTEGAGIVVNDGANEETIYLFKNRILLKNANVEASYDFFTKPVKLRVVGVGNDIRVYVKVDKWELLVNGEGSFDGNAQILSNSSSFSNAIYSNKRMMSVWHSNKGDYWQIYSNQFNGVSWEEEQQLTFTDGDSLNPDIFIDNSDITHIVYQDNIFGNNEIFYAQFNGVNLLNKTRVTDSAMDSINPKVRVTDNGDVHIAWLDNRNSYYEVYYAKYDADNDEWVSSGAGGDDEKISNFPNSFEAKNLQLESKSNSVYAIWNDNRNSLESVYLATNFGSGWNVEQLVSDILYGASYPSIKVGDDSIVNIVWQDLRFGNSEIFYRSFDNVFFGSEERISDTSGESTSPCIAEYSSSDLAIYWKESSGVVNNILLGVINDGIVNSSGGGGSDVELSNSSVSNILDIDCLNADLNNSNYLFYIGNDGYQTVYSYRIDFNDIPGLNLDESSKVSNLNSTKLLRFGDITNYSKTISEWGYFSYAIDNVIDGLIVESAHIDGIKNIHVDNEDKLYVLSFNGLDIYRLYFDNSFISNDQLILRSSSSPINLKEIKTFSDGAMVAIDDNDVYYSHALSSDLNDKDMPWMKIGVFYNLGNVVTIDVDSNNYLWLGYEQGMIVVYRGDMIVNNIISEDNAQQALSGKMVNSFSFEDGLTWIAHNKGVSRYVRSTNSETVITVSDGLIDKNVDKVESISPTEFYMFGNNGLAKWNNGSVTPYRDITATNNINDILFSDGGIWLANDLGIEFFNPLTEESSVIGSEDGYEVVDNFDNYRIYKYEPVDFNNVKIVQGEDYRIVSVNGVFRDSSEYVIDSYNNLIIFRDSLNSSAEVNLINYTKSSLEYDFSDPQLVLGLGASGVPRILELVNDSNGQTIAIIGSEGNSIAYQLGGSLDLGDLTYPSDTIVLDITPPTGTMDIVDQLTATEVLLDIRATDEVSGVDKMVLSNYQNFTTDGITPSPELAYSESAVWNLGATSSSGSLSFEFPQGMGNVMFVFNRANDEGTIDQTLFAGTSDGAFLYRFDPQLRSWDLIQTFVGDEISDITVSGNNLYVCTSNPGNLYSSSNGLEFILVESFVDEQIKTLFTASDSNLYIGTGNEGRLYVVNNVGQNNQSTNLLFDLGEDVIYDITEFAGSLYLATGDNGRIYRMNIATQTIEIIYDDADSKILTINASNDFNSNSLTVYAGTDGSGKILRLIRSRDLFVKSFQSASTTCRRLKTLSNEETYACVDNKLFQFNKTNWKGIYIDDLNQVVDVEYYNGQVFVLTDGEIKFFETSLDKFVYIKFIDFAGNETTLYDDNGDLKPRVIEIEDENGNVVEIPSPERLWDSVTVEELEGFSLQGRLIVYDENGQIVKSVYGSTPYLTAGRVDEEKAVYVSEQFDGTNDLLSWDSISYVGTTPSDTEIVIQIKTYDDFDGADNVEWSEPVSSGLDISGLNGRFIQFRATLISRVRGITPVLNNVTITAKTTFGVHYFTTNFVLPSNLQSGILSANVVKPEATEIVFGIGTDSSTNWNNYQVIPTEKLFVIDERYKGENLRVGIRFLSSSTQVPEVDEFALIFSTEGGELIKLNL